MRKHIPNFLTVLNLLTGCFSVYFALTGDTRLAGWLVGIAALLDFLDGFMARMLKAYSPIGKILDSLADVISFGLAPGVILLVLMRGSSDAFWLPFIAFLVPAFSALRLAKFSIDELQAEQFIGVPTPANALFIASFPLILADPSKMIPLTGLLQDLWTLVIVSVLGSLLLVSPLPMLSMKFKDFSWLHNQPRYLLIALSVVLLPLLTYTAIPLIFAAYLVLSVLLLTKDHK
jgi:CDP-diacylglycerol--serine O-phosphatidyltransferase